ncbi:DUF6708 domain-containing protein, partial [Pseudomonas cremoricolorata]|uniref:DUF6708 domain-containing protein n=1 Tax=Pseudomonas cremoricolorata TaxID=157783 RepID=UPI001B7F914A
MSVIWLFRPNGNYPFNATINGQISRSSETTIQLHNPVTADCVLMGKMHCVFSLTLTITLLMTSTPEEILNEIFYEPSLTALIFLMPFIPLPVLAYEIWIIRSLSSICLNRSTQKIYYQRFSRVLIFDWKNTAGGLFKRREFGGSSFSTSYALAFAPYREDGTLHEKDALWIDSNEPTESDVQYVAEVWEYLRQFMDHGPDNLPPPGPANWWHKPLHAICLTPAEAWRHYAPWRTGEPGEMQGKKNWQLPFWAVLFPYNLTVAICWYGVCKLFNVKAAPPP